MISTRPARGLFALLAIGGLLASGCRTKKAAPEAAATPAPAQAAASALQKLVGRWLRSDADYSIEVRSVAPDGTVDASYRNPNPIRVSRAQARSEGGIALFFLELNDRGYPGNFYTLTYDAGSDSLSGTYHHLGLNQSFEIAFSRVDGKTPAGAEGSR
jgi:hypothetical protein